MSSNNDIISTDISIFDDLTIFPMSSLKKWRVKRFFKLEMTCFVTSSVML